jgi:hypothetical protein
VKLVINVKYFFVQSLLETHLAKINIQEVTLKNHENVCRCSIFSSNPILFAVSSSTFNKLCKNLYNSMKKMFSSAPLYVLGSMPLVALRNEKMFN